MMEKWKDIHVFTKSPTTD